MGPWGPACGQELHRSIVRPGGGQNFVSSGHPLLAQGAPAQLGARARHRRRGAVRRHGGIHVGAPWAVGVRGARGGVRPRLRAVGSGPVCDGRQACSIGCSWHLRVAESANIGRPVAGTESGPTVPPEIIGLPLQQRGNRWAVSARLVKTSETGYTAARCDLLLTLIATRFDWAAVPPTPHTSTTHPCFQMALRLV